MSRCSKCNAAAFEHVSPKEAARGHVPAYVYNTVGDFWRCTQCSKIFWMGPKSKAAVRLVEGMLQRMRHDTESPFENFWNDGYQEEAPPDAPISMVM